MPFLVGYVTPQDYGAVGNGVTDDTTAFQNAVNAISTAGGGTLFVPGATYVLSAAISVPNLVSFKGVGQNVSILKQTSTSANVLTYAQTNLSSVNVSGIKILGPGSGTGVGISFIAGAGVNPVVNCSFRDLLITGMGSHGISVTVPITSTFENIEAMANGGDGFHLTGGGTSCVLNNCYANGNLGNGYSLNQMNYTTLNSCAADSSVGVGYLLTTCNNVQLNACGSEAGSVNGFTINGGTGNSLISCFISGNNAVGAQFTGSTTSGFITGFRENAPAGGATASVRVDSGSRVLYGANTVVTATSLDANGTSQVNGNSYYAAGNGGTSSFQLNRGATTNFATYQLLTNGVEQWVVGGMINNSTNDMLMQDAVHGNAVLIAEQNTAQPNMQLLGNTKSFGGGVGVVGLADASTPPTTNPTGGMVVYSQSSKTTPMLFRDTAGNERSMADAYVRATAGQNVTSATQTASTFLHLAIQANSTYLMECGLIMVNTTGSWTPSWTGPAGATMQWNDTSVSTSYSSTIGATNNSFPANAATRLVFLKGILFTSATAGTLTFTFNASAGTTTLQTDSWLRLTKVS